MELRLTEQDGRVALRDHAVEKASAARRRYGGCVDSEAIVRMLDDRDVVRWPTRLRFDLSGLEQGEFAHAQPVGDHPRDGFVLFVHPAFEHTPEAWPPLIAYHIVRINYGDIASHEEAELFGATLLGIDVDEYYERLCNLADGAWLNRRAIR